MQVILNRDYSGVVDVVIDGKTVTRSYTLKKGDAAPKELGEYLLRDLPHYVEIDDGVSEKMATSPKDKMIGKAPKDK